MKNKFYLAALIVFVTAASLFCEGGDKTELQDVTIKGELNLKIDSERPKLKMDFDTTDVIIPTIKTNEEFLDIKPKELLDLKSSLVNVLSSSKTIAAYLNNIVSEPVASFDTAHSGNFQSSRWEFIVSDAKGEPFYSLSAAGKLPETIVWSGRNSSNEMVIPGKWYSYLIKITDTSGGIHTVIGKPFHFAAILHQESRGLVLSISDEAMFGADGSGIEITGSGRLLLDEAADTIKRFYSLPLRAEVYSDDKTVAANRAQNISRYLTDVLIFPADRIQPVGESEYVARHRVDIVLVNR